jgi:hypothetical protein
MSSPDPSTARWPAHWAWLGIALATALGYLFELGGDHIPRNGDELVYAHIARLTAESGHWLPLVSSYDFMRNTKPPLLFWQAMVAGGWGEHWTLLDLRLPSVIYLWATALMVGLLAWKVSRNAGPGAEPARPRDRARLNHHAVSMGAIAATLFLSFFSTYRYGRPYLTSAPETFCCSACSLPWPGHRRDGWHRAGSFRSLPALPSASAASINPLRWWCRLDSGWRCAIRRFTHVARRGSCCGPGFSPTA